MAEIKIMTCIVCPVGCEMTVRYEGKRIDSVEGNVCKRGLVYARAEIENPRRTLTTTISVDGGEIKFLPVKTDAPIPKGKLFEAMRAAKLLKAAAPVKLGEVICADFIEQGINLIAGRDIISTK